MRLASRISLIFLILLTAYTIWPFVDLYRMARMIERRDVAALTERLELRTLRSSLGEQVLGAYLQATGREASAAKGTSSIVTGLSISVAESTIGHEVSAAKLIELLTEGLPAAERGSGARGLFPRTIETTFRLWLNSEYSFGRFFVSAPVSAPPKERFRFQFRLTQWVWKLADVQLPQELRLKLAREVVKMTDPQRAGGTLPIR